MTSHWEPGGAVLPFQVAQTLGKRGKRLVPPCSFSTVSAWPGCTSNTFKFRRPPSRKIAPKQLVQHCPPNATAFQDTVVLVYRSYINTMHFLNDQVPAPDGMTCLCFVHGHNQATLLARIWMPLGMRCWACNCLALSASAWLSDDDPLSCACRRSPST